MSNSLTIKEIEGLGYYDFMGYMGIPFFNIGGFASIDRLAELCKITEHTKILEVGCGTGANACYLAKTYRCSVVGIDVAEYMVKYAQKRASDLDLNNRVSFKVGDAYNLEFQDKEFDLVLTIFVSQFLEPARVFPEFFRVLKVNGYLGVNEMYKADDIPDEASQRVNYGERVFRELTDLPFTIKSPVSWRLAFESAGFSDILLEERSNASEKPYANSVSEFGGYISLISTLWKTLVFALKSRKIRKRFGKISKVKGVLLQDKLTSKYMGYILCVGRKPLIYPK
ncbi:MAG: class I SAM-dependent methyltransferase [Candidatus Bathyarchaeota archaeon]|nr:class I SAM-dependent methyltransferase [Candidatus Bathyarchaeota archaeon]